MNGKSAKHFKDDIRRTFIIYAVLPISALAIVFFILILSYWNTSVFERNRSSREAVCDQLSTLVLDYMQQANEISAQCNLHTLPTDKTSQRALSEQLYRITNELSGDASFYVMDAGNNLVVSSAQAQPEFVRLGIGASWGIIARMRNNTDAPAFDFINSNTAPGRPGDLAIGKAVTQNGKIMGYVVFVIPGSYFLKYTDHMPAQIVVTDRYNYLCISNNIAYSDQFGRLAPEILNEKSKYFFLGTESYYLTSDTILKGDMTIYAFTPVSATISALAIGTVILLLVLVIVGFAIVFGAQRIASSKTQIIDRIVEAFEAVKQGNLDTHLAISTNDEFEIIGDAYNIMLESLKDLIRKNQEEARQTVLSEIKQLESQFNPHFLFNTLENIRVMAKLDPDTSSKMILSLSTLLRYSINSNIRNVTLEEDIIYTENYMLIQKYRFGDRFHYKTDIAPDARACIVPKLMIQPIIENAIKYGFGEKEQLTVRIKAVIKADKLLLTIVDNGDGIEVQKLKEIQDILFREENSTNHIGLFNISRRIALMYGSGYGLTIKSEQGRGTCVEIVLPIQR